MRRETFVTVENILRDFPRVCESLRQREQYLESIARNSFNVGAAVVSGGDKLSSPELKTDIKINDAEYNELLSIVEILSDRLYELPATLFNIIKMFYFEGLMDFEVANNVNYSDRCVKGHRLRAIRLLVDPCLSVHRVVERWRQREKTRQLRIMTGIFDNFTKKYLNV